MKAVPKPAGSDLAVAVTLALAAGVVWFDRASAWGIGAGAVGAAAASLCGARLAAARMRAFVPPFLAAAFLALALGLLRLLALAPVPGAAPWPEHAARLLDALTLAAVSAAAAFPLGFWAARRAAPRVLAALALALMVGALLAPHRGGAINRPLGLADMAWLHGWHPALLLTVIGVVAGALAAVALLRPRAAARAWATAAAAFVLAVLVVVAAPTVGLFRFPFRDPFGLSGDPREGGKGADRGGRPGSPGRVGALGLEGQGNSSTELVPFQDDYSTQGSNVPVAVAVLHDDVEPTGGVFYFRQLAFSQWNGRRLVRAYVPGADADLFDGFPAGEASRPAVGLGSARRLLPATVSLLRDHVQPPVLADGVQFAPAENADPALFTRVYETRSAVLVAPPKDWMGRAAGDPAWPEEVRKLYLETPPDPRYQALAQEVLEQLRPARRGDPAARAIAVYLWLSSNTRYSLRSRHAAATDPTADFLFGDRIGYCVHLAHAAAYLARELGLPARVAAGYAVEAERRASGSALLLRAGDAHAWAEIYLDGIGWMPLDPSPPSLDPPAPAPDIDLQRLLGEMARPKKDKIQPLIARSWRLPTWRETLGALALAFGAAAAGGYAVKGWRRAAPLFARRDRAARAAYRASLDRLTDAGFTRRLGETREAFAARAAAPSFGVLTARHLAARFGRRAADPREALALARAARREMKGTGGLRRIAALVNPWSWRRSR